MISRLMTSKGSSRRGVDDGFGPIVRRQDVVRDSENGEIDVYNCH